jgi:hypothetical protein
LQQTIFEHGLDVADEEVKLSYAFSVEIFDEATVDDNNTTKMMEVATLEKEQQTKKLFVQNSCLYTIIACGQNNLKETRASEKGARGNSIKGERDKTTLVCTKQLFVQNKLEPLKEEEETTEMMEVSTP